MTKLDEFLNAKIWRDNRLSLSTEFTWNQKAKEIIRKQAECIRKLECYYFAGISASEGVDYSRIIHECQKEIEALLGE